MVLDHIVLTLEFSYQNLFFEEQSQNSSNQVQNNDYLSGHLGGSGEISINGLNVDSKIMG